MMYGGTPSIATKGLMNSEFNPIKLINWGLADLNYERELHKSERQRRAEQALLQNDNDNDQDDNVQDDNVQDDNVQDDNLNDVQHEDDTGLISEVGEDIDQGSDAELEFIGNLFELEEEIDKTVEDDQTDDQTNDG
jgi:hypothetical protein